MSNVFNEARKAATKIEKLRARHDQVCGAATATYRMKVHAILSELGDTERRLLVESGVVTAFETQAPATQAEPEAQPGPVETPQE